MVRAPLRALRLPRACKHTQPTKTNPETPANSFWPTLEPSASARDCMSHLRAAACFGSGPTQYARSRRLVTFNAQRVFISYSNHMHIETLQTFCAVVETGSVSLAAKRSRVTQSAVSQQLRALEQRYGRR